MLFSPRICIDLKKRGVSSSARVEVRGAGGLSITLHFMNVENEGLIHGDIALRCALTSVCCVLQVSYRKFASFRDVFWRSQFHLFQTINAFQIQKCGHQVWPALQKVLHENATPLRVAYIR